jgi:hypothetical protein
VQQQIIAAVPAHDFLSAVTGNFFRALVPEQDLTVGVDYVHSIGQSR